MPDNADQRQRAAVLEVQLEAARRELATAATTLAIERQRYADQRETFETMLRCYRRHPNVAAAGAGRGGGSDDDRVGPCGESA